MIGKTNIPMGMSKGETVSILLKTNQLSNDDLNGVKVVVSYDDESHEYSYNGQFSVEIPKDKTYTVTFSEVDGYKTPSSVTYTAVKGFSRSVEVTYSSEFLTLNVTGTSTPVVTIKKVKEVGISEKYKVVDYVETDGTQYIDTGFKPNNNTRVVMDMQAFEVSANGWAFGGRDSTSKNSMGVFYYYSSNKLWSADYSSSSQRKSFSGIGATDRIVIDFNKNICSINGVSNTFTATTFQSSYSMVLFAVNTADTVSTFIKAKLYSCKIYDNDILVRDYIPALRSDGVAGLYDAVNDTFSSSTGSLVGGGYISDETIATQTSVSGLHKIAYDTEYMIEASAIDGLITPEVQYYTANQPSRNVSVDYLLAEERVTVNVSAEGGVSVDGQAVFVETGVPSEGVYIEDTSYKLWTADEWDNSATANSIVVSDGSMARRVSLTNGSKVTLGYFDESCTLPAIGTQEEAELDMNGKENTSLLKKIFMSTTYEYKQNYELYYAPYNFPDGSIKGYVPSLGELIFLYEYNSEINSALEKCGADAIKHSGGQFVYRMFSSTVRTNTTSTSHATMWTMDWNNGSINYHAARGDSSGGCMVRYMADYSMPHTITNGKTSFSVPYDETYTVSLSDMDGYTTPESQTYTASQPTREISMEYKKAVEHVVVNVVDETGAFVNGQTLTVSGGVTGSYTITGDPIEFDVHEGLTYTVSVNDKNGYTTPESQTFTAGTGTREIDMVYKEVKLGVFIQGVSGKLYETAAWTSQETPNGVAVITENCRFVMALEDAYYSLCQWGGYRTLVDGITTATSESTAKTDYDGEAQTTTILDTLGNSSSTNAAPAAYYCRAYTFPNGKKGYLGAAGEWQAALDNITAIKSALSNFEGAEIREYYWTSTQYNSDKSWDMNFDDDYSNGYLEHYSKITSNYVRAFCSL